MKWRFRCIVCGKIIEDCLRIEDVYYNGKMNLIHCKMPLDILVYGAPFK